MTVEPTSKCVRNKLLSMNATSRSLKYCPACGISSTETKNVSEDFIEILGVRHFFSVDICMNCGLIYSKKRTINESIYLVDFDVEKEHGHQCPKIKMIDENTWNYQIKKLQSQEILGYSPDKGDIRYLEIGASDGTLFRITQKKFSLKQRNLVGTLVESSGAAELCNNIVGCSVISSSIHDVELSKIEPFDIIVMSHCLEHFEEPKKLLAKLIKNLKPNGVIYIEVPDGPRNAQSIATPLSYYHLSDFNSINLQHLMQEVGFTVESVKLRDEYPGLRIIAKKENKIKRRNFNYFDRKKSISISLETIEKWNKKKSQVFDEFNKKKLDGNILIYGMGAHTIALIKQYPEFLRDNRVSFSDSNARIKRFLNRNVLSPDEINFDNFDHVVISSYAYQNKIEEFLINLGCEKRKLYKFYETIFSYVL